MNTYKRHRFPPKIISSPGRHPQWFLAGLYEARSKFTGRSVARFGAKGAYPGGENPDIPDEADAVDAVDVVVVFGGGDP